MFASIPVTDTHETLEDTSSGPNAPDIEIVWSKCCLMYIPTVFPLLFWSSFSLILLCLVPLAAVDNGQTKTSSAIKAVTLVRRPLNFNYTDILFLL